MATIVPTTPVAAATAGDAYAAAVAEAKRQLETARPADAAAAARAARILEAGTGTSQQEILGDLRQQPPATADAVRRLESLQRELQEPAGTPRAAAAATKLHEVLAQPRYSSWRDGPTWQERLRAELLRLMARVARTIIDFLSPGFGAVRSPLDLLRLLLLGAAIVGVGAAGLWLAILAFGRSRARPAGLATPAQRQQALDAFVEADRLAAAGDYTAAVRWLTAGVAAALGGSHAWTRSPLTVREIFAGAERPETLRPLLSAFEMVFYGQRRLEPGAFEAAAASARQYRGVEA